MRPIGTPRVALGEGVEAAGEADPEHIGIPDGADHATQPAQLGPDGLHLGLVQQRAEAVEIRAQSTGGHPQLVHFLLVIAQPCAGVMTDDQCHRASDGVPHQVDDRGVVEQRGNDHVGGPGRGLPQRTHELGHGRLGIAPGADETGQCGIEQSTPLGTVRVQLDFDLSEPPHGAFVVRHRNRVVDHLGQ